MADISTDRPKRRRGPAYDPRLRSAARTMRELGDTYQAIADALGVPLGTVQYWTQGVTASDSSGRWTLAEAAAATVPDAAIVMAELGAVILATDGRVTGVTRDEARWITLIARVEPHVFATAPGLTWERARTYIKASAAETDVLDEAAPRRPRRTTRSGPRLQEIDRDVAESAARSQWSDIATKVEKVHAAARKVAADLAAGRDPFLNAKPYRKDDGR